MAGFLIYATILTAILTRNNRRVRLPSGLLRIIAWSSEQTNGDNLMNIIPVSVVALFAVLATGVVEASDLCNVPESNRQPVEALQQKLEDKGWQVKKIKIDDGCYEAYAVTDTGQRVEAYFDPKTFDLVKSESE